jgi:hypothetical protein
MENGANTVKLSAGSDSTDTFDCIWPHISDILDFLADVYTLSKFKSTSRAMSPGPGFDEDNLSSTVKAGMVQVSTLEVVPFVEMAGIKNYLSVCMSWL